jgi:RNA polymerase sigma-70 factor (ECF subfamily)
MDKDLSFEEVLAQLRLRDNDAATAVYQRFARRLIAQVRKQLGPRILKRIDPDDVVQSVFKSVFVRLADGQFTLGDWDSLWGLLTRVTLHKCLKWTDYFHAQSRSLDREGTPSAPASDSDNSWEFIDREPTPPEAAMLAETVEQVLLGLNKHEQEIVTMSLQGYQAAEISAQLGCTEAKVYRLRNRIRRRLERMRDADPEA